MRLSLVLFGLVAALLLASVAPSQATPTLEDVESSFSDMESLGVSGRCLAKCAVKVTACVAGCNKRSAGFSLMEDSDSGLQKMTCKQSCAAKAAGCAAVCAILPVATDPSAAGTESAELSIDASNVDAAFAALESEEEPLVGGKGKCLAKCGVKSAACLLTCKKKMAFEEEEADEQSLQLGCKSTCMVNAASCAALCVIGREQSESRDADSLALVPVQPSVSDLVQASTWPAEWVSPADEAEALSLHSANRNYPLYKQCDGKWGSKQLGTGKSTICQIGCAMSSLAMALASYGVKLAGAVINPGSFNDYLKATGGYVNGQLLVWSGGDKLGGAKFRNYWRGKGSMSVAALNAAAKAGKPVIVNVKNGGHWVLVTGASNNGRTFPVNDPGANKSTFEYSEMSNFIEYA